MSSFIYTFVVFRNSSCSFLGWVDQPMCPRLVKIIPYLLRSHNDLEDFLDMVEETRNKLQKYAIISWFVFALYLYFTI